MQCHPDTVAYYSKKDDPIAPFETVKMHLLESALTQPKWDYTTDKGLADITLAIAKSDRLERDEIIIIAENWIRDRLKKI